jgi:hypothetical protein
MMVQAGVLRERSVDLGATPRQPLLQCMQVDGMIREGQPGGMPVLCWL